MAGKKRETVIAEFPGGRWFVVVETSAGDLSAVCPAQDKAHRVAAAFEAIAAGHAPSDRLPEREVSWHFKFVMAGKLEGVGRIRLDHRGPAALLRLALARRFPTKRFRVAPARLGSSKPTLDEIPHDLSSDERETVSRLSAICTRAAWGRYDSEGLVEILDQAGENLGYLKGAWRHRGDFVVLSSPK